MPLTLNVGLSKKIGLPDYGSLGVSCNVQVELDQTLLLHDLDGFHHKVKQAYVACHQAVNDELHRQQNGDAGTLVPSNGKGHRCNIASNGNGNGRPRDNTRRATASQVRALDAIAHRQQIDLPALLQQRFGAQHSGELAITEASGLIEELNSQATNGGHR